MGSKKHKKHKRERHEAEAQYSTTERPPALKLILKVGGSSGTPEHGGESPSRTAMLSQQQQHQHYQQQSGLDYSVARGESEYDDAYIGHKKLKKKKKKKDKRHKHHRKDKKRRREESSQESVGDGDESLLEAPKRIANRQTMPLITLAGSGGGSDGGGGGGGGDQRIVLTSNTSGLSPHREPRTCVLRKIAERTPLQRLLEHLLRSMEKRDPQQFFAWPVTDNIAPGYSQIITNPMDFSTIKQRIDENGYRCLNDFVRDFKLMCDNATTYNHPDTIYFKAAKKLLHVGSKMVTPEKLRQLRPVLTYMRDISKEELGFELGVEDPDNPDALVTEEQIEKERELEERNEEAEELRKENQRKLRLASLGKFEAIPDDLSPEEISKQARHAARTAAEKLSYKRVDSKMGFLRQKKDGTTSLQIIVPGDGVIPGTNQRPVSLGQLIGKLSHGTGALAGFREDRRNMSKPVKPLYYGAFGSYAPSYDSTFANLTKEETDLVYQTYGDESAVQYAESIIDFAKDTDYTLTMVDDLLDILTGGEHRKTKKVLDEKRRLKEEEEKIRHLLEKPAREVGRSDPSVERIRVDIDQLKSLSDIGIDVDFLDDLEEDVKLSEERASLQSRLDDTSQMLNRLRQVQHERLSAPPPAHLSNVPKAQEAEAVLADKVTDSLTEIAKKLPPSAIAPVDGLRRAMGIAPVGPPEPMEVEPVAHDPTENPALLPQGNSNRVPANLLAAAPASIATANLLSVAVQQNQTIGIANPGQSPIQVQVGMTHAQTTSVLLAAATTTDAAGVVPDLESELREFLESDPTLGHSPLHDDKTLEDILSES